MDIFYEYLIEANKALDNYTELSEYQSLFEATKSEEIAEIEVNNKNQNCSNGAAVCAAVRSYRKSILVDCEFCRVASRVGCCP